MKALILHYKSNIYLFSVNSSEYYRSLAQIDLRHGLLEFEYKHYCGDNFKLDYVLGIWEELKDILRPFFNNETVWIVCDAIEEIVSSYIDDFLSGI